MNIRSYTCSLFLLLAVPPVSAAEITASFTGRTARAVAAAFDALGVQPDVVTFDKSWDADPFRLPRITEWLRDPLLLVSWSDELFHQSISGGYDAVAAMVQNSSPAPPATLLTNHRALCEQVIRANDRLRKLYHQALPAVSQNWLHTALLLRSSHARVRRHHVAEILQNGAEKNIVQNVLNQTDAWLYREEETEYALLALLDKLPLDRIISEYEYLLNLLHQAAQLDWKNVDRVYWRQFGIMIGTTGSDFYTNNQYWCFIDPGGDDIYRAQSGFAAWGLDKPVALILDLGGNDRYESNVSGGSAGAALGVSIVLDTSGDDYYSGGALCQGSAVGGAAMLCDLSGNDYYYADAQAQGYAYCGVGSLVDLGGDDLHSISTTGQGFGYVRGYGILYNQGGNDLYLAGRGQPDAGRYSDRFLSISQGVGMGMRPCASGGIGLLVDTGGNDVYKADVFGQGVGYWYGLGLLIDNAGNDTYSLFEYGQGAGVHLACGVLLDGNGDDVYTARNGIAQGASHDFAVGILRDYAGHDQYQGRVTVQGSSINNGVALLIDENGNDWYSSLSHISQGYGRFEDRRDFGSLGFCIDVAGKDWYHDRDLNGYIAIRGLQGIIVDYHEPDDE